MLDFIFKGSQRKSVPNKDSCVPENRRIYAVGDIHGRADLLQYIHDVILEDSKSSEIECKNTLIYLGDYIDRGFNSREVLDLLIDSPLTNFEIIHLKGNHEDLLLEFLEDSSIGSLWSSLGGDATICSYKVKVPLGVKQNKEYQIIQNKLCDALPLEHLLFLANLKLYHEIGDYIFVHAGIMPGRQMSKQTPEHMMWIRDEFLKSNKDHGKVIVHGHTMTKDHENLENRIGIDTGGCYYGKITCLVLEGNKRRFLTN